MGGQTKKMDLIFNDFVIRYVGDDNVIIRDKEANIAKSCPLPDLKVKYHQILNDKRLKKMKEFS